MKIIVNISSLPERQQAFEADAPNRRLAIIEVLSREMVAEALDKKNGEMVISAFKKKGAGE
jgi:hypothetical protein